MFPNKAETAVQGCRYLGDMAMRMPDCWLVFERRATCFYCSKRVTFVDCAKCVSIPLIKTG